MADLTGSILLGRYRIDELAGRGGMSDVYRAFDLQRGYQVAIKVLREDLAEDREFIRRFQHEAATLSKLKHANIVRFYSFEREGFLAFIVMDFISGQTLRRRLLAADGPLPLAEALDILQQVGRALQYAHAEGILHRDIKPGNVMLSSDGRALLSDFGIAKMLDTATMTAIQPGTPTYMAPEQYRGLSISAQTDIYGLGVMAYEMLAGRRPFLGETQGDGHITTREALQEEHLHHTPPPPERFNPTLPTHISTGLLKALAKRPEDRFASVSEFIAALGPDATPTLISPPEQRPVVTPLIPYSPPPQPEEVPADKPSSWRKRQRWVVLSITAMILFVVVVAGYAMTSGQRNTPAVVQPTASRALIANPPTQEIRASATKPPPEPVATKKIIPSKTNAPPEATSTKASTATKAPTSTDRPTFTTVLQPVFTAKENMACREGPDPGYDHLVDVLKGSSEDVLARWSNGWLLLSVSRPDTRTKCCWVGGDGDLNMSVNSIRLINVIPDRMECELP